MFSFQKKKKILSMYTLVGIVYDKCEYEHMMISIVELA